MTLTHPVASNPFANASELRNLELMQKFTTDSFRSVCADTSVYHAWQVLVPQKALSHNFLMYGLLAFTSLHIASTSQQPVALSYVDTAIQYYNMTFSPFRDALDNLTSSNCDAVFANSILVAATGLALPRLDMGSGGFKSNMIETISVASDLIQGVTRIHEIGRAWFSSPILTEYYARDENLQHGILDSGARAALSRLSMLNHETVMDQTQRAINQKALSVLEYCFSRLVDSNYHKEDTMSWLILVDKEFSDCLKRREPFSLLILMHWAVLLDRLDGHVWWVRSAGKDLVSELTEELRTSNPLWEAAKTWPQQIVSPVANK